MISPLRFLLTNQLKGLKGPRQVEKTGGFTLIELLVAMLLAALVITPLLGFMINILDTDRKEQAKTTSEQEIKSALDYIAQDLQQAVYIYDADGLGRDSNPTAPALSGIKNQLPPAAVTAGVCANTGVNQCLPVLVFWKREQRPNLIKVKSSGPACPPASVATDNCDDAFVYSLIGYYLITENNPDGTWSSKSRIARFKISDGVPNYSTQNQNDYIGPNPDPGFQSFDLGGRGSLKQKMNLWVKKTGQDYNVNFGTTVLLDYIDKVPLPLLTTPSAIKCDTTNTDLNLLEQMVPPPTAPTAPIPSFYACVNSTQNWARIYIRGNALARIKNTANDYAPSNSGFFPTATIQVKPTGSLFTQ